MPRNGIGLYQRGAVWYLDFRHHGRRHVIKIGRHITRSVAAEIAQVKRAAILRGEAGITRTRQALPFTVARAHFERWAEANKKPHTVRTYRECLRRLAESFEGKCLSEISPFLIEQHKQRRIREHARVRCNRELAVLKTLFHFCRAQRLYEGPNPVTEVAMLKEPARRLRFLEPEEEQRLIEAARSPLKELIVLGVNTGLRIAAEALRLRWEDVDWRRGLLTVPAAYAKSGTTRTIPLNARAVEALTALRASATGPYVFSKPNGAPYRSMNTSFTRALRDAGLAGTGVSLHTLRHTFASRLVQAGTDLRTVQELGGWSDLSLVQRYAHVGPSHKHQAVSRIAELFHNAFHNSPSAGVQQAGSEMLDK